VKQGYIHCSSVETDGPSWMVFDRMFYITVADSIPTSDRSLPSS
jgi:hypothetical protein